MTVRVLILTGKFGMGHWSAAQSLRQELLRECGFRYFTTFTGGKPEFKEL